MQLLGQPGQLPSGLAELLDPGGSWGQVDMQHCAVIAI